MDWNWWVRCFYKMILLLLFRQLFERALLKNQNQNFFSLERSQQGMPLKIIKKKFRGFFGWIKIWKIM